MWYVYYTGIQIVYTVTFSKHSQKGSVMAMPTPAQLAEKWGRRLKGAVPDIQAGVQRVTVSPTEQAAEKQDKMLTNLTEAVNSGKWAAGLRRVSLDDWRQATLGKGIARLAQGVDGAVPKVEAFAAEFLPHLERGQAEISRMPDLTLEDNIGRMVAMVRHNAGFKRSA